jgi:hypothetical protein
MERKILTETAKEFVIESVRLSLIEASTLLPNYPVPENRGLRDRVNSALPDSELMKMIPELTWMFNPNVWSPFAGEETTSHDDKPAFFRIDFFSHSVKAPSE